jgi:hypothetical protein
MRTGVAAIRRADAANSGPGCNIRDRGPFITVAATRAGRDGRVATGTGICRPRYLARLNRATAVGRTARGCESARVCTE